MVFLSCCLLKAIAQDFAGQTLEVTVWDKDQRSKDDFMGRFTFPTFPFMILSILTFQNMFLGAPWTYITWNVRWSFARVDWNPRIWVFLARSLIRSHHNSRTGLASWTLRWPYLEQQVQGFEPKWKDNLLPPDPEAKTFLPMWDQSAEAAKKRKVTFFELQLREQYQQLPLPPPRMPLVWVEH